MVGWHHQFDGHEFEQAPGSWWWTGRPGMLQSMGLQRVRHDWATELNWTELAFPFSRGSMSPALQVDSLPTELSKKPQILGYSKENTWATVNLQHVTHKLLSWFWLIKVESCLWIHPREMPNFSRTTKFHWTLQPESFLPGFQKVYVYLLLSKTTNALFWSNRTG